ncbi:MAG: hypothetical protein QNL14_03465, partial [Deltaproteobacteria bacterium]|nr:hypothetical protein [Deltaproteobacteria bacterium]
KASRSGSVVAARRAGITIKGIRNVRAKPSNRHLILDARCWMLDDGRTIPIALFFKAAMN